MTRRMQLAVQLALASTWVALQPAGAVILFGLDNAANQTDPGTGVPFSGVGMLADAGLANPMGTAIYLGGGYMLTANHVGMKPYVTFDGATYYQRDTSFTPVQVAANVDMQVFRLTTMPTVAAANLYRGVNEQVAPATQVGWGLGRSPTVPVDSVAVTWGDASTLAKRWGLNTPRGLATLASGSGSYAGLYTVLGSDAGSPAGLGASEAAATLDDSGSGLFQNLGGTWYLIGLTTGVDTFGTSNFGNDQGANPNGDLNYSVRVGSYSSAILAIIPEPSSAGLLACGLVVVLGRRRTSRH